MSLLDKIKKLRNVYGSVAKTLNDDVIGKNKRARRLDRFNELIDTRRKLYEEHRNMMKEVNGVSYDKWVDDCGKLPANKFMLCLDEWGTGAVTGDRQGVWADYIPELEQKIQLDPFMYTDSDSKFVRDYARQLIQGD